MLESYPKPCMYMYACVRVIYTICSVLQLLFCLLCCMLCFCLCRKRNPDSSYSADIQRLLNLASQVCHAGSDSTEPHQPPPCAEQVVDSECVLFGTHNEQTRTIGSDQDHVIATVCDDDEAFWSQAADVVEERGWQEREEGREEGEEEEEEEGKGDEEEEGEGEEEGDSAFIDGLLSSGLIRTPRVTIPQSYHDVQHHSTPHTSHPSSCSTPHHSSLHTSHPSSSSTPVSHRSMESGKSHLHPLF